MHYPCNYGYIPRTLSDDGDPCDVLVLSPVPLITGVVVRCRPIGMLKMDDEAGGDAKILAVPIDKLSSLYRAMQSPRDLPEITTRQIAHFFEHYKDLEPGKWVRVSHAGSAPEEAKKEILDSATRYEIAARSRRADRAGRGAQAGARALSAGVQALFPALFVVLWSTGFIAAKLRPARTRRPYTFCRSRFACVAVVDDRRRAASTRAVMAEIRAAGAARRHCRLARPCVLSGRRVRRDFARRCRRGRARCWSACSRCHHRRDRAAVARRASSSRCQWLGSLSRPGGCVLLSRHKVDFSWRPRGPRPHLASRWLGDQRRARSTRKRHLRAGRSAQRRGDPVLGLRARRTCRSSCSPVSVLSTGRRSSSSRSAGRCWSLSVGAISLLYWLLRHGAALPTLRAFFYLVPPVTAAMAFALFGETTRRAGARRHGADRSRRGLWRDRARNDPQIVKIAVAVARRR